MIPPCPICNSPMIYSPMIYDTLYEAEQYVCQNVAFYFFEFPIYHSYYRLNNTFFIYVSDNIKVYKEDSTPVCQFVINNIIITIPNLSFQEAGKLIIKRDIFSFL